MKCALENACLDTGWFAYPDGERVAIAQPPRYGQDPDLDEVRAAGGVVFFGSVDDAIAFVRRNPRRGSPTARLHVPARGRIPAHVVYGLPAGGYGKE